MNVRVARFLNRVRRGLQRRGIAPGLLAKWPASLTLNLNSCRLKVPLRFIGHFTAGQYEAITQDSFRRQLKPGMTVVDVGAHIGFFSVLASQLVGRSGLVYSLEPFDESLEYLRANIRMNHRSNIHVYPFAAGNERRKRVFHVTGSSDSNGFFEHPNTGTVRTVDVEVIPLDDLISGPVDAVKIDVEGAELLVLDGMKRVLAENPQITLWVEWMPACMRKGGFDPFELPRRLHDLGFNIELVDQLAETYRPLAEAEALVRSGSLPEHWYANLIAKRS